MRATRPPPLTKPHSPRGLSVYIIKWTRLGPITPCANNAFRISTSGNCGDAVERLWHTPFSCDCQRWLGRLCSAASEFPRSLHYQPGLNSRRSYAKANRGNPCVPPSH